MPENQSATVDTTRELLEGEPQSVPPSRARGWRRTLMLDSGKEPMVAGFEGWCCRAMKPWCRVSFLDQGHREQVVESLSAMIPWPVVELLLRYLSESEWLVVARLLVGPGLKRVEAGR